MNGLLGDITGLDRALDSATALPSEDRDAVSTTRETKATQLQDIIAEEIFSQTQDAPLAQMEGAVQTAQTNLGGWGFTGEAGEVFTPLVEQVGNERVQRLQDIQTAYTEASAHDPNSQEPNEAAADLHGLLVGEIVYLTQDVPVPERSLDTVLPQLKAWGPDGEAFAAAVDQAGADAVGVWAQQGRSEETLGQVLDLAEQGEWQGMEDHIVTAFGVIAETDPTQTAIENYRTTLLNYGPDNDRYREAVEDAVQGFLVDRPQRAADDIAEAYEEDGFEGGAAKLRELTEAMRIDPESGETVRVDPLTAALILDEAAPTIDNIISDLNEGGGGLSGHARGIGAASALSAAVDNASRSPEARETILDIAEQLAGGRFAAYVEDSVGQGNGVVLPLAVAAHLKASGDTEGANDIVENVADGVEDFKESVEDSVDDYSDAALPLIGPRSSWSAFFPEDASGSPFNTAEEIQQSWENDEDNQDTIDDIGEHLQRLDVQGYQLERSLLGLQDYAPRLDGLEHQSELRDLGEMPNAEEEDDARLAAALSLSPAAFFEHQRHVATDVLGENTRDVLQENRLNDINQTVPDPSWPTRMGRNHIQAVIQAVRQIQLDRMYADLPTDQRPRAARPASPGLSIFGAVTYLWGARNQASEFRAKLDAEGLSSALWDKNGWRNLGFMGFYARGAHIEARQAIALARGLPVDRLGASNIRLLRGLALWNVIGTIDYIRDGKPRHAAALGTAAAGGLLGTFAPVSWGVWTGPVGTALVVIGSTAIFGLDQWDRSQEANETEPFNEDYLIRAGLRPEIANELANNDSRGRPIGPQLEQLADHLGQEPQQLLEWFNEQDPEWVHDFVTNALHPVDPNDEGEFRVSHDDGDVDDSGMYPTFSTLPPEQLAEEDPERYVELYQTTAKARSLDGIIEWAETTGNPLPGS